MKSALRFVLGLCVLAAMAGEVAAAGGEASLPLLPAKQLKRPIPSFRFLRREYALKGKSVEKPFVMRADGTYAAASGTCTRMDTDSRWGLDKVEPKPGWVVGFGGSAERPMDMPAITLLLCPPLVGVTRTVKVSEGDDIAFGPDVLAFDAARSKVIFWYSIGTTTDRRHIIKQYDIARGALACVGETYGSLPQWSADHKWLVWTSGEVYSHLGRLMLKTWNLRIFSVEDQASYVLTEGVATNTPCSWLP